MKPPVVIRMPTEEFNEVMYRVESHCATKEDCRVLRSLGNMNSFLCSEYEKKKNANNRLLRMLYGAKTEKTKNVLAKDADKFSEDKKPDVNKEETAKDPKKKIKGHGKNGANTYTGAETILVKSEICGGDQCTLCPKGKLYKMSKPGVVVGIYGSPLSKAKVWEFDKFRCNLCGAIFEPELPKEAKRAQKEKYDDTAISMIALAKYGFGLPFYRQEKLQACLGVPLPASTQWDKVEKGADLIYPAFEEMKRQAGQGEVLHNDDTDVKILELMKNNVDEKERKGMFTTGILSIRGKHKIALFLSGRKHAGENIADVLAQRKSDRSPPIQMCDALSRNYSEYSDVFLCNCNVHARRNFIDVNTNWPKKCAHVLKVYKKIYKFEDMTKKQNMSDHERLEFHQLHSGPVMDEFYLWLDNQFKEKKVEPNSDLGGAITYMFNHWKELTLFLEVPGAPLDNNAAELMLKRAILNRKNSLFFKTLHGAYIGDMYISMIHTCILADENPYEYLTQLQMHSSFVFKNPGQWMPWKYKETITNIKKQKDEVRWQN